MSTTPDPDSADRPGQPAPGKTISAMYGSVAAERIGRLEYHEAPRTVSWPVLVGQVPGRASAFQARTGLRDRIKAARERSGSVVLTQVLSGGGGVGKSQLAASYAADAVGTGTDLVVWADATQTGAVIQAFAQAAARVRAPGADGSDAETDARAFLAWAASTSRSWLVVLDDLADPGQLAGWWPASHTGTGWVLATTRRRDAVLTGAGRALVDVDVYSPEESRAYLADRLTPAGQARLLDGKAGALAGELGHLPLALSHAAAYMIDQQITCAAYLGRYTAGRDRLDALMPRSADTDGYGRTITATLLLALDAADACDPAGLARPAIRLASVLDPAGHPETLWATETVTGYLTQNRTELARPGGAEPPPEPGPVTAAQARAALLLLHRYSLAIFDGQAGPRAVRVHALTARAARETTPAGQAAATGQAAAGALAAVWPDPDYADPALAAALRANTTALAGHAKNALWYPDDGHPVLFRAGNSLLRARLHAAAITHWQRAAADSARMFGGEHPYTLTAQANLAESYRGIGRTGEAIIIGQGVAAEMARILGAEDPHTLTAQADLALSYRWAGRTAEAITIEEQVAAAVARILGPEHPDTLTVQTNLATSYAQAGRTAEAITIGEQVAAAMARIHGPEHPDTLTTQAHLARSYRTAGRTADAITIGERVAAGRARIHGPEHPDTLEAQADLAQSYWRAGRTAEAITILERVAAAMARIHGPEHPDTLNTQSNLAVSYSQAGRTAEAITIGERVAAAQVHILGLEHPDTLATVYWLRKSKRRARWRRLARVGAWLRLLHADAAPTAARNLGALAGQGDTEGAKAAWQQAIDSGHADMAPTATFSLGALLADRGDADGAKAAYQQAIDSGHADMAPTFAVSLGALLEGALLAGQGDAEGAKAAYQQAIDSGHADMAPIGLAYLLRDPVAGHVLNEQSVRMVPIELKEELWLRRVLRRHERLTGSPRAAQLLRSERPLPFSRVEPLSLACSVAETWDAILTRFGRHQTPVFDVARVVPLDGLPSYRKQRALQGNR